MRSEEEIRNLIERLKISHFGSKEKIGVITLKDVKSVLIKNLEWVLEGEE